MIGSASDPKTVYILGAGFSKPAGAPLQHEILPAILKLDLHPVYGSHPEAMNRLCHLKFFLQNDLSIDPSNFEKVTLEDVFTPIDRCIFDKTSFRSQSPKDLAHLREEFYSLIVLAIKAELERPAHDKGYVDTFAKYLDTKMQVRDAKHPKCDPVAVISTNWDILLDDAIKDSLDESFKSIKRRGVVDYCCYLSSIEDDPSIKPGLWALGTGGYNVKVLKLHGSMNWLHCPNCQRLFVKFGEKLAESLLTLPVYCKYCISELIDKEPARLHSNLLMPTFLKDFNNFQIKLVWQNAGVELFEASELVFIGYSLPSADFEFRSLLARMVRKDTKIVVVQPKLSRTWTTTSRDAELSRFKSFFGTRVVTPFKGIREYMSSLR